MKKFNITVAQWATVLFCTVLCNLLQAQYLPRSNYGAKLEPKDLIIHGAGQSAKPFEKYSELFPEGKKPLIYMTYSGLKDFPSHKDFIDRLGIIKKYPWYVIPQIGLSMTNDGKPEERYEHLVADGKYDADLNAFCKLLNNYNRPVFLRIGYEFNGHWNGYKPEDYKAAFKRVANAIRKNKNKNVAIVWCFAVDGDENDFMKFYPGDEYVDWWGIDIFGENHFAQPETQAYLDSAAKHRKPVMIGESTPRRIGTKGGEETWKRWFGPYFSLISNNPGIKAFCYINWDWTNTPWPDWGDGRIETGDYIRTQYVNEITNGPYLNGTTEKKVCKALNYSPNK